MKKTVVLLCVVAARAHAWQFSVGTGADWAQAPALGGVAAMTGVSGEAVLSRQPFAGRRWALVLGESNLGTALGARHVEAITAWRARVLWEWRLPLFYRFRPWWGAGIGADWLERSDRYITDALGYAQSHSANQRDWLPTWSIVAVAPLPAHLALQLALTSGVGPHPLSTVTASLLWRIF